MDQKTIDDMVKGLVEERLKVLGKIPKNYDNLSNGGEEESLPSPQQNTQQKSVNSPALVGETPGKDTGVKRTLAEEFDKDTGVKRTLAEEFATDLDFVYVSPSKATKDDKDDKDAKVLAYATDKKKAVQAEAALKRKEKADAKRKEAALKKQKLAELKNQEAEAKRKEAELKKQKLAELKKQKHVELKKQKHAGEDSECAVTNDESDFYSILIHERPWPEKEYGWVFDNVSF
ncbi:unnamed protein product [Brassica oleracea var. botrytis]